MSKIQNLENILSGVFCRSIYNFFSNSSFKCFTYHDINIKTSEFCNDYNLNVTPENFEKQIIFIKEHFNLISPSDLNNIGIKDNSALITFDDGFNGIVKHAVEILERHKVQAIAFMNMSTVESGVQWAGMLSYMYKYHKDWMKNKGFKTNGFLTPDKKNAINEFFEKNSVEFKKALMYSGDYIDVDGISQLKKNVIYLGNHLYHHFSCSEINNETFIKEYEENDTKLSNYKNYLPVFAYPYGQPKIAYNSITNNILNNTNTKKIFLGITYINNKSSLVYRLSMTNSINTVKKFRTHCILPEILNRIFKRKLVNESV
jgi:peptidoglycan/xylan/chitin deacetylase (PgdA/CDA1 family)